MIVYRLSEGFARDLHYEEDDYQLKAGEVMYVIGFGELPPLESLHDPAAVQKEKDAEAAAQVLLADLVNLLRTESPAQISAYVDNVTDAASRQMFKRVLLVLAFLFGKG